MKKVTKFFMAALLAGMCSFGYGQDYLNPPKANEKVITIISVERSNYCNGTPKSSSSYFGSDAKKVDRYKTLLEKAQQDYPNIIADIRDLKTGRNSNSDDPNPQWFYGPATGKVVDLFPGYLSQAINKALRNVREGSRMAIDQVTVISSMDKETLKDQLLDVLLDKGYKVVAKEYLERLYEEQQNQQSGIYNDKTTVQENNFSAVGYYINVKVTETSLRVQVINVSTGEYEGNSTVNF